MSVLCDSEHKRLNEIRARYIGWECSKSLDIAESTGHSIDAWMEDIGFLLSAVTQYQTELWSNGLDNPSD